MGFSLRGRLLPDQTLAFGYLFYKIHGILETHRESNRLQDEVFRPESRRELPRVCDPEGLSHGTGQDGTGQERADQSSPDQRAAGGEQTWRQASAWWAKAPQSQSWIPPITAGPPLRVATQGL